MRKACFPPVVDERTRLLLLGSLPGDESLRQAQYYAHPQNRFWELAGEAIDTDLRALSYERRLDALRAARIGLWDVVSEADRRGSLDSAIRNSQDNDLAGLLRRLPDLAAIGFNGKRAAVSGRRLLRDCAHGLELVDLPSSSPAYAAMPFEMKRSHWIKLRRWLATD